ncbi:MAG: RsmB/NOP family class I SAM-dependent RNA methyltransferase [Hyphomicrobiales bacterium]
MRLAGRLAAAIEVLETLEDQRRPVAHVLKDWGHAHRFAGSGDRNAIGNLVHDALRHRRSLAAKMGDDSPRAAVLGAAVFLTGYLEGPLPEFEGDKFAPAPLSEAEQAALAEPHVLDSDTAIAANAPDWLWPAMQRVFGEDASIEVGAMAARAPVDLRLNPARSKPERVDKALSRFTTQRDDAFPQLRRIPAVDGVKRAPHVTSEEAFQKGWIEVQDAGSQLVSELAVSGIKPRSVIDYCAGAGGKSLALSVFMGGKGQVFAHDINRHRMADLWPRVKRSGAHNIQVVDHEALASHEITKSGADCVVLDAPCTGSGTWRRHPDTKWRVSESTLETRMGEQDEVLAEGAKLTKPGGRLVYITCSLTAEENEDRLVAFLAANAEFSPTSAIDLIAGLGREAVPDSLPSIAVDGFEAGALGLRLTPATSGTDGFYIACLTRSAE